MRRGLAALAVGAVLRVARASDRSTNAKGRRRCPVYQDTPCPTGKRVARFRQGPADSLGVAARRRAVARRRHRTRRSRRRAPPSAQVRTARKTQGCGAAVRTRRPSASSSPRASTRARCCAPRSARHEKRRRRSQGRPLDLPACSRRSADAHHAVVRGRTVDRGRAQGRKVTVRGAACNACAKRRVTSMAASSARSGPGCWCSPA